MAIGYGPRVVTDGLVLCLDAADRNSYPGSGTTWTDLSGRGNTGTLTNGPTYSSSNGGSIVFDGTNDYVTNTATPNPFGFPNTTFTVSAWTKSSATSTMFSVTNDALSTGWGIGQIVISGTSYGLHASLKGSGGSVALSKVSTKLVNDNIWHNVVVIFTTNTSVTSSNTCLMYIDGVIDNGTVIGTAVNPYIASSLPLEIGRRSSGNYFSGNIAQASIYNRALSASEIQQNYNATRSRFGI